MLENRVKFLLKKQLNALKYFFLLLINTYKVTRGNSVKLIFKVDY